MAKAVPLFSGSKGNSYYIGSGGEGVLIDAGRNCKQIELALEANSLDIRRIGAIFITHEHTDHCSALRVLAHKYRLPVYATPGTLRALSGKLYPDTELIPIADSVALGNMQVERVRTSHDAAESCCFRVTAPDGKSALIATDTGYVTDEIRLAASKSDFVVLESNHDIDMLRTGPYPFYLQQRILSNKGHLSNDACSVELAELVSGGTCRLMLGHLSEMNNTPDMALRASVAELERAGMKYRRDYTLQVAPSEPKGMSVIF